MITIIDYGIGNVGSIKNMLKKVGSKSQITSDLNEIKKADKLILPGVGSFDFGMTQLKNSNLISILNQKVLVEKKPILGICLGMQLLTKSSEEGKEAGLGWVDARTLKFKFEDDINLKVPHMGWNDIQIKKDSKLLRDLPIPSKFYFVHSYYVKCEDVSNTILSSTYGHEFTCGIEKENILGVQFHPEKSHKFGMKILKNFSELY
ncbi:MAG: imidazole glycerol phosphate synthase subunit HisH [Bacteroidetes bacterium]|nr:imidazole glycerol phosphate synthase subunit HisH [Bacteroidota bacterium]